MVHLDLVIRKQLLLPFYAFQFKGVWKGEMTEKPLSNDLVPGGIKGNLVRSLQCQERIQ